ncbi:hypothetical protein GOP47_0013501 [Adiantum capillus-veneris]|uniref:non-specific serine/threonine protein kinase n=1 Tax=Adiantum capillus-veneris TaxID=13818 RepID=A0A9D4UNM9_ADICA|nr:hypothetical protein GOP47_0013501 [Adiantum capillus-veneris]
MPCLAQQQSEAHDSSQDEVLTLLKIRTPKSGTSADCDNDRMMACTAAPKPPELWVFTYTELRAATRNFSRSHLLGEGGFGCVYRANLKRTNRSGTHIIEEVAVKQLNKNGQQGHKEWLSEVHFLGMVEHPNVVRLVGYCAEDNDRGMQRLLVYEFMPNKSLEYHLFPKGPAVISWEQRLNIMLGAARGLAYLHEEINGIQVIFRDFKTSNILLDKDFTPKLSDFGLARQGPELGESHVTTVVVGTQGYAAPEYISTGHLTSKSDVWSFGVVLLEMLAGRRSVERNRPKNEQQLLEWMKPYLKGQRKIESFVDEKLEGRFSLIQAERIAALALQCLNKSARVRPLMSEVVEKLKEIVKLAENGNIEVNALPCSNIRRDEASMEGTRDTMQSKKGQFRQRVKRLTCKVDKRQWLRAWTPIKAVHA